MAGRAVRQKIQKLLRSYGETEQHLNAGLGNKDIAQFKKTFKDPTTTLTRDLKNNSMFDSLVRSGGYMSAAQAKYYMPKGTKIKITRLADGVAKEFVVTGQTSRESFGNTAVRPTLKEAGVTGKSRTFDLRDMPLQASLHGKSFGAEISGNRQSDYWKVSIVRP